MRGGGGIFCPLPERVLKKESTLASESMLNKSRLKSSAMMVEEDNSVMVSKIYDICSMNNVGHVLGGLYICPTITFEQGKLHCMNTDSVSVGLFKGRP